METGVTQLWNAVENLMTASGRPPIQTSDLDSVCKFLTLLSRQRASVTRGCTTELLPHPLGCAASHPAGVHASKLESRVRRWLVEKGPWANQMQLPHAYTPGLAAMPWHSSQGARLAAGVHPEGDANAYAFESLLRPLIEVLQRPRTVRRFVHPHSYTFVQAPMLPSSPTHACVQTHLFSHPSILTPYIRNISIYAYIDAYIYSRIHLAIHPLA